MADLAASIAAAKKAGYSDAEIAAYIGKDPSMGPKVAAARQHGYSDTEIVGHLATPAKRSLTDDVTGFMSKVNRGLGVGDEMAAGMATAIDLLTGKIKPDPNMQRGQAFDHAVAERFRSRMALQRQTEDSYQAAHPNLAALATGVGNAATIAAPVGPGAEAFATGGRAINALRGATVAGLTGAGYAAVDRGTLAERAKGAAAAARDPVTLALGAGAGALSTVRGAKPAKVAAPTLEQLTAQKNAAYKAVDASGLTYTPKAFRQLTEDMATAADEAGFHGGLHPKTAALFDKLRTAREAPASAGYAPTLSQLDQLRQQIGSDIAASTDPGERRMGQILRGQIDAFIDHAGPEAMTGGDPQAAPALIKRARDLNTRVAKINLLDNLEEKAADRAAATGSGGNINNATRQDVIRFKNKVNNLTPDEQVAAQKVIDGTPVGNALRQIGKLSPRGNGLMLAGHIAAAVPTHGMSGAVAIGGAVSKVVSDAMTARNVQALRELIASGGQAAAEVTRQLADPQYAEIRAQLASDLAAQAGVQGSARRGASVTAEVVGHPEYGTGASRR